MPCKLVHPPRSNPLYLVILVSTLRELLVMTYKIVHLPRSNFAYLAIMVPEAINLKRLIGYAMQNHTPT